MTVNVLFVCLGNICRSPTAHGVFQHIVDAQGLGQAIHVDSAGTAAFHVGKSPDERAVLAASRRGYDLSPLVARQVSLEDYERFDFILPMDRMNLGNLQAMVPSHFSGDLRLFREFGNKHRQYRQIPDPYNGGEEGFELVLDLIEDASHGLLNTIKARL